MITVEDLKKMLEQHEDTDIVVIAKDGEGNAFSPLYGVTEGMYVPSAAWIGEVHLRELTPSLREMGYTDEDVWSGPNGQEAIVLWPTN